ncbi:MAG: alpha/beta fold hydrolase [Actinobacteria bacterium]|nr:alpha/beta fold hydrolase [Actinomycetota bacterium]MBU1944314.1 alpha/beta fold hydrolase [Actinomycetota bacterium]MBU2688299.1 alpha/beta fold hydrolase [Actinomycetota bacterium]
MSGMMPNPETVEIQTADGVTLRCRRYRKPGARAVVCGHGLASSAYAFDLPLYGFNIARVLYGLGYEVWLVNFRGAGHPPWRSDDGGWGGAGDELGVFDLPAVIEHVYRETGRPVFYTGHSFGGMSIYVYLQGAAMEPGDPERKVHRDPAEARRRNRMVAGALTVGSMSVLVDDPRPPLLERISRFPRVRRVLKRFEDWLIRRAFRKPGLAIGRMSRRLGFRHPLLAGLVMSSPFLDLYMVSRNMGFEACRLFGIWAGGDVAVREVAQTVRDIRTGEFSSYAPEGHEPFDYGAGMGEITTPLVAAAGTEDFIRPLHVKGGVIDRISSERKRFIEMKGYGHVDMLYHLPYAEIMAFLEEGAGQQDAPTPTDGEEG